jgi:hypothetical protein
MRPNDVFVFVYICNNFIYLVVWNIIQNIPEIDRMIYLEAFFDSIESMIYVATSAVSIGQMIGAVVGTGDH